LAISNGNYYFELELERADNQPFGEPFFNHPLTEQESHNVEQLMKGKGKIPVDHTWQISFERELSTLECFDYVKHCWLYVIHVQLRALYS